MPLPDSDITLWTPGYPSIDTNEPAGSDIIGTNLDDQFRLTKSVTRAETLNKGWERWKGMYGVLSYVSTTQFSLTGNQQTSNGGPVEVNRRVKVSVTAGTLEGFISAVAYNGTLTTVTVVMDGIGSLDNGLSEVQFGIRNEALPQNVAQTGTASPRYAIAAGTNTYTAGFTPPLTLLNDGDVLYVKILNANTVTTPTLNPDSLGAKTIVRPNGSALAIGDLAAGMIAILVYSLSADKFQLTESTSGVVTPGTVPVGSSGDVATVGGVVAKQFSVGGVGNVAGGGSTILFTHTFNPNSFDADGKYFRMFGAGTWTNTAITHFIQIGIGGVVVLLDSFTSPGGASSWAQIVYGQRVSATQFLVSPSMNRSGGGSGVVLVTVANMVSNAIAVELRAAANNANTILANMFLLEFYN